MQIDCGCRRVRIPMGACAARSRLRARAFRNPPSAIHPAFTLVELLTVIAILAILISTLLPALSASRRSAQAAVCASNLRQVATANLEYSVADSDYLVPAASDIWD